MCGVNGGWHAPQLSSRVIQESLDAMIHRGPDDSGMFQDGPVFLGNRRLSIIDLEGGRQPIFNEDASVAVVLNGEIYNYLELIPDLAARGHTFVTRSDTEVLVHLYEEEGPAMCDRLRGMFAFAIWDASKKSIFLARDRFGKKPLYYSLTPGSLLFASELKSLRVLAEAAGFTWTIRDQAIFDYLSLGVVPQPDTVYEGVKALPAGSWMKFDGEELDFGEYWRLQYLPKTEISYEDAQKRVRELLAEAVSLRLRSDTPLGVFLSGGLDSSVVAYEASQELGPSLKTFTVSFADKAYDESSLAARTAERLGVRHTVLPLEVSPLEELQTLIRLYDQPFADSSAIPSLAVSRLAREHVKVILNGDGGDELFAGYRRYVAVTHADSVASLPIGFLSRAAIFLERLMGRGARRTPMGLLTRFLRGAALHGAERYLAWTMDMLRGTDKEKVWLGKSMRPTEDLIEELLPEGLSNLDTQMLVDIRLILLSALLVKMDMATMGASLEGRSPLMDHEVAEFAARLPDDFKIRHGMTKALIRDAYKGLLPDEVIFGKKRGFDVPLLSWLQNELRPVVMDTLGASDARVRSYIDGAFVDELLAGKTMRDRNWAELVYSILMLELWLRERG